MGLRIAVLLQKSIKKYCLSIKIDRVRAIAHASTPTTVSLFGCVIAMTAAGISQRKAVHDYQASAFLTCIEPQLIAA